MQKAMVSIILLVLSGCMWSHAGMDHGGDREGGSHHHH